MGRHGTSGWLRWTGAFAIVSGLVAAGGHAQTPTADPQAAVQAAAEARTLFDALDYEHAVPALDRAIGLLDASPSADTRDARLAAYEMRARAKFGLGDRDGTVADMKALLGIDPAFAFGAQVSPRIVSLLDEVRKTVIGTLALTMDPADAHVSINGAARGGGEYTVEADRVGYAPARQPVTITAGQVATLAVTLTRTSPVVYLVTTPGEVEVAVDGVPRGRTRAASAPDAPSAAMVLTDVAPGSHAIRFTRPCYAPEQRTLTIDGLGDYRVEPVALARAVATVEIDSVPAGAAVTLDGEAKGTAPVTVADVCAGSRRVELRSPHGRYVTTIDATPGAALRVHGVLKPAFAVLPTEGNLGGELRASVARALAGSEHVTLVTPEEGDLDAAGAFRAPAEWLSFDAVRRPIGGAASVSPAARRDLSTKLAGALDVQGVASIAQPSPGAPDVTVALLAAGAAEPDVIAFVPDRLDSVAAATARLDYEPALARSTLGALLVEATGVAGVLVAHVDAGGPAAAAGLHAGDVIAAAGGTALTAPGSASALLRDRRRGDVLPLEIRGADGSGRTVSVTVAEAPRLISAEDRSLLCNSLVPIWRSRLAAAPEAERPYIRLNLGVALLRVGDYAGAREQFEAVHLPPGPGIAEGTGQYLLGLALEGLGDSAGARKAWQAAAASEAWLTEDGPPVRAMAARKLGPSSTAAGAAGSAAVR